MTQADELDDLDRESQERLEVVLDVRANGRDRTLHAVEVVVVAHERFPGNFSASRFATTGGTKGVTSPP